MCSSLSLLYVVVFLGLSAGILAAALYEGKFARRLSEHHPETWRAITARKIYFSDGDQVGAATVRYLWSGAYRSLGDATLNSFATRGFVALAVAVASLVAWLVTQSVAPEVSLLACFRL